MWTASGGEVSKYTVTILDGDTEMTTRSTSGPSRSIVLEFNSMKNGYRYNVSIVAHSKTYDNGQTVESDPHVEEIKTTVQGKFYSIRKF